MKMVKKFTFGLLFGVILCTIVTSLELQYKKNKSGHTNSQIIRPNIADLNSQMKIIKPFIEKPFIPTEVDKLAEPKKKVYDESSMSNAILVGPVQAKGGLEENPSMYSTVIDRHATSVIHPVPQPTGYQVHPAAARAFQMTNEPTPDVIKSAPGAYSIPVKIEGTGINDPTLSGYETPNFIHKGEKQLPPNSGSHYPVNIQADMQNTVQDDIQSFVAQFDNSHDKEERIKILKEGNQRLSNEAKQLSLEIDNEMKELLFAKEVALKLQNVIANYNMKMRKDQLSKLKLADEVTIKSLLRDKLHRELQGFRTSPGEFKELEKVNPADISRIISDIKLKIGH